VVELDFDVISHYPVVEASVYGEFVRRSRILILCQPLAFSSILLDGG
jgi:hypothetical protein